MTNLSCYFHPNREAKAKCEKCGELICFECKMVFDETKSKTFATGQPNRGGFRRKYSVRHEFCPVCYYSFKEQEADKSVQILAILGFFAFTFSVLMVGAGANMALLMFVLFIVGILLLIGATVLRTFGITLGSENLEAKEAREQREAFLESIGTESDDLIRDAKKNKSSGFCSYCGGELEPGDNNCSTCGKGRK